MAFHLLPFLSGANLDRDCSQSPGLSFLTSEIVKTLPNPERGCDRAVRYKAPGQAVARVGLRNVCHQLGGGLDQF